MFQLNLVKFESNMRELGLRQRYVEKVKPVPDLQETLLFYGNET
ncbi:hypothetical protein HanPI659440_Chr11g0426391 [Helianthus annuus]|nr:hypothetical protein HanPI659440_Chr11g0426391 [Helianthus annuus]